MRNRECIEYKISKNETLFDIFRRFDISIKDLREYNESCDVFSLREGQTILIKDVPRQGREYVLQDNETLRSVAEKFGLSVISLLKANTNYMPGEIRQGAKITLPEPD
ncbi:MAG: LysM peptidoglycan-binding domain-containing protein [Burkholderiales bacterium]|jgi:LysM repeat protein